MEDGKSGRWEGWKVEDGKGGRVEDGRWKMEGWKMEEGMEGWIFDVLDGVLEFV